MKIKLSGSGKRFNREWIFRNADLEFTSGNAYAITGPNGSGKSTLLQCIGGMLQLSEGTIQFEIGNPANSGANPANSGANPAKDGTSGQLADEEVYKTISFCAPYLDVIEEMNLVEFLGFHKNFKPFMNGFNPEKVIAEIGLQAAAQKQIRYYSSGMKQRVKLAQAIFSDAAVVLLDEPCSNLDSKGIELYHHLVKDYCKDRLLLVCSNDEVEYSFCKEVINITNYKPVIPVK